MVRKTIPVIRSAALIPILKWLIANDRPVESLLRDAGLSHVWIEDPYAPVPIRAMEAFVLALARKEGPDIGCRVISENTLADLGALGALVMGTRTPRDAIKRTVAVMPCHCSHEIYSMTAEMSETRVNEYWTLPMQPEALHVIHQYVAAILELLLRMTPHPEPSFTRLQIIAHPIHGLDHLRPHFDGELVAASRPMLTVTASNAVLDTPFRKGFGTQANAPDHLVWKPLSDGTMTASVLNLIRAMLRDGAPSVDRLSRSADMSVRTLQRRLGEEGQTFSDLVESVRREMAMAELNRSDTTIGNVAANLGYSNQSSLTRAVRRWTGRSPISVRLASDSVTTDG